MKCLHKFLQWIKQRCHNRTTKKHQFPTKERSRRLLKMLSYRIYQMCLHCSAYTSTPDVQNIIKISMKFVSCIKTNIRTVREKNVLKLYHIFKKNVNVSYLSEHIYCKRVLVQLMPYRKQPNYLSSQQNI